jgi:hypothetical protein
VLNLVLGDSERRRRTETTREKNGGSAVLGFAYALDLDLVPKLSVNLDLDAKWRGGRWMLALVRAS